MVWTFVSGLFLGVYGGLIFFYFRQWKRLPEVGLPAGLPAVFVSVVIAARNEEETLPLLLEDLYGQTYPEALFEVIVVNDFSTDGTAALATRFRKPQMRMLYPEGNAENSSKKKALAAGIRSARGELIIITDADCRVGSHWVAAMAGYYQQTGASFIAAPVQYTCGPSLVQVLQVLDFITLQGITAASVGARFHTLCNGANLAYTKKAFEAVNGFAGIDRVPTGDDMLLMYKIWKLDPARVFYLKSRAALVTTAPMPAWRDFFMQRRRWASKTPVFDDFRVMAVLGFVLLLNLWPVVLLAAGFFKPVLWLYLLLFLVGKALIEFPFVLSVAKFYRQQKLLRYFFFLQPLHVFYTVLVGLWSQVGRYEWKGRRA